ncbi:MAG: MmcQ/YjbR family DNA-binding protein [Terracidiphilus sp.]
MDIDAIRRFCLQFPHVTENVQWGYDLVFKIDGKMFLVMRLEPGPVRMSFKASAENFDELCERPGVRPAPYMARAQWIALEQLNTLPDSELRELLAESYRLVFERLPKRRQQELQGGATKAQRKTGGALGKKESPPAKKNARGLTGKTQRKTLASKKKSAKAGRRG